MSSFVLSIQRSLGLQLFYWKWHTSAIDNGINYICFLSRVVMVLGAGRGPLVTASLRAAVMANRKIKVYAVEKNPNAVVT